jgi:hypothetical protein
MYTDKLDGRITQEFFDRNSATWRGEQEVLLRKIRNIQTAAPALIDQAIDMLRLMSRASELFLQQSAAEQRRLLQVVVEKAAWQDGALRTTLFEPFEMLRHSNQESYRKEKEKQRVRTRLGYLAPQKCEVRGDSPERRRFAFINANNASRMRGHSRTGGGKQRRINLLQAAEEDPHCNRSRIAALLSRYFLRQTASFPASARPRSG